MRRVAWLLLPLLGACVTARLERERRDLALAPGAVVHLEPGATDLQQCLELLGAPLWVQEHDLHGLALGYGHLDEGNWRVSVSVPVTQEASASFRYERGRTGLYGHVLYFDEHWRLQRVVEGWLDAFDRPVPAAIEDLEEPPR